MLARVRSAAVLGIDGYVVEVEADLANGLPSFSTVGLPHGAVKEGRERVTAALLNSGFDAPLKRITIVDEDIDIRDRSELDWVMSSHVDPARDVQVLGGFPAAMDHAVMPDAQGRKLGGKLVIDATRSLATGPISLPAAELMERARATWTSAGLPEPGLSQRLRNCLSGK